MSGIARDKMHLTSKLWNTSHNTKDVEPELDQTLKQLGTDYLDLYLMHWPIPFKPGKEIKPMADDGKVAIDWDGPSHAVTWKEMVRIQKETKKARAVGVCNHTVEQLERIIKDSGVTPAVNQIEGHPTLLQPELFKFCKDKGIAITCYSPLGHNITGKTRAIDESKVNEIAQKLGKDAGQVLIAWALKSGFSVIPKSVTPERIEVSCSDSGGTSVTTLSASHIRGDSAMLVSHRQAQQLTAVQLRDLRTSGQGVRRAQRVRQEEPHSRQRSCRV